jgi:hypothetical protein
MHIMDLVLQGVRRFDASRKFPLKPGLNVVYGPTESGKSTLLLCLLDLMYPDRFKEAEAPMVSRNSPQSSRAGLTLGAGQDIYRIIKDFKTGQIALSQFNRASQKFDQIASTPAEVASMLASTFELPPFDIYYHLFVSAAERMPSALPLTPEEPAAAVAMGPVDAPGSTVNVGGRGPVPAAPMGPSFAGVAIPASMMPPGMMIPPGMPGMSPPGMPGMMPGIPGMMTGAPGMMPGMPGMMPGAPGMMTGAPGMMPGAGSPDLDDSLSPPEREQRLKQLRLELVDAQRVDAVQYEIDGLQQRMFEVESKSKGATQFDEFLSQAKAQLDRYASFSRLPEKIEDRLENYGNLDAVKGREVDKISAQQRELDAVLAPLTGQAPLWKQQLTLIGAGSLVLGVALMALFAGSGGPIQIVGAVATFAGVGLLVFNSFQYISREGKRSEVAEELAKLEEQKEAVMNRFNVEHAVIAKMMKESDADSVEELQSKIVKYRDLQERYQSVLERKKKLMEELNLDKLNREEGELKKKINGLEEELRKFPALSMGLHEMNSEIDRLERVIRMVNPNSPLLKDAKPASAPAPEGFGVPILGTSSPGLSGSGLSGTRVARDHGLIVRSSAQAFERLVMSGARLLESERPQIIKHIAQRFNLYIQALFGKRYSEARIDPDCSIALKDAASGKWVDFETLTPAARDTGFLALQITMLELATQKHLLPVILDNSAVRLDENAVIVAAKALQRVSERTQVIFLTAQRAPVQFADHSMELS